MYSVPPGRGRQWFSRPVIWAAVAVQFAHVLLWRSLILRFPNAWFIHNSEDLQGIGPVALGTALVAWATVRHARDRLSARVLWALVAALGLWTLWFGFYMGVVDFHS